MFITGKLSYLLIGADCQATGGGLEDVGGQAIALCLEDPAEGGNKRGWGRSAKKSETIHSYVSRRDMTGS